MFHRDYIQRMIEQFGELLRRLVGLRMDKLPDVARDLIDEIYDTYFPFKADMIRHTRPEDMSEIIKEHEELSHDHWTILADLLKEEGELWYSRGDWSKGDEFVQRAINVLEHLNTENPAFYSIDREQKIQLWKKRQERSDEDS